LALARLILNSAARFAQKLVATTQHLLLSVAALLAILAQAAAHS
jgi:hypothetical protein